MSGHAGTVGRATVFAGMVFALFGVGCGGGVKTYPVKGKVVLVGGDVKQLAGQSVELTLEGDLTVRAYGPIEEDGSFSLGTLHEGKSLPGALPGKYHARLVLEDVDLPDEEDEPIRLKKGSKPLPVHPRFLKIGSGLTVEVPTSGEVTLKVSKK